MSTSHSRNACARLQGLLHNQPLLSSGTTLPDLPDKHQELSSTPRQASIGTRAGWDDQARTFRKLVLGASAFHYKSLLEALR